MHVIDQQERFVWREDPSTDWAPWPVTLWLRGFQDDCDGAAALGQTLIRTMGRDADIVTLIYDRGAHAVAISHARNVMTSNGTVYFVDPANWRDQLEQLYPDREILCIVPELD